MQCSGNSSVYPSSVYPRLTSKRVWVGKNDRSQFSYRAGLSGTAAWMQFGVSRAHFGFGSCFATREWWFTIITTSITISLSINISTIIIIISISINISMIIIIIVLVFIDY